MKPYFLLFLLALSSSCRGVDDTNAIALGEWSRPVANYYGLALRGRLAMYEHPHYQGGTRTDTALYLELEEYSNFVGGDAEVYFQLGSGEGKGELRCELTDEAGKVVPESGFGFGGGAPVSRWVEIPTDARVRLRVSVFGGGRLQDGGLGIWSFGPGSWTIKGHDTNTYFLSGTFTADPPTNRVPKDFRWVWQGKLNLPKMKIPANKK
jgi:hypothetical protein